MTKTFVWCDNTDSRLAALEAKAAQPHDRLATLEAKMAEPRWDQAALDVLVWRVDQLELRLAEYDKEIGALVKMLADEEATPSPAKKERRPATPELDVDPETREWLDDEPMGREVL